MCTILRAQVSAELSLWEDCLRAYHRLLELESKFLDVEILELLVCAVTVCAGNEDCDPPGQCSKGEGGTHSHDNCIVSSPAARQAGAVARKDHSTRKSPSSCMETLWRLSSLQSPQTRSCQGESICM